MGLRLGAGGQDATLADQQAAGGLGARLGVDQDRIGEKGRGHGRACLSSASLRPLYAIGGRGGRGEMAKAWQRSRPMALPPLLFINQRKNWREKFTSNLFT